MTTDDASLLAQEFPSFVCTLDQSKIDELTFAIRDENPIFRSSESARAAGLDGVPVPLLILASGMQTGITGMNPVEALGLSRARVVHAGHRYRMLDTIYAGDALAGQTRVAQVTNKTGRSGRIRYINLETVFQRDGETVATTNTIVAEFLDGMSR